MTHNPTSDSDIAKRYSASSLEHKSENKTALQEELSWNKEPKKPMICIPAGMSEELGKNLFESTLPGILSLPVELLVLGKGDKKSGEVMTKLTEEHGHRVAIIPSDEASMSKMLAAADIALFFTKASAMEEFTHALQYGCVPVAPSEKGVKDYNPNQESGYAFTYAKETEWHCFAALVRALETHRFPYDWRTIQKLAMEASIEK